MRKVMLVIIASLIFSTTAVASTGVPQPEKIRAISKQVFGSRWRTAACIAHYESTDGAHLYNGTNLGPWQIDVSAHKWVDQVRVVHDWYYSARVAWIISNHGKDWRPWGTHNLCGV